MRGGEQLLFLNSRCFDNGLIVPVFLLLVIFLLVRFDCARARTLAYAWLRARAQSDTGVGRILMFGLLKIHPNFVLLTRLVKALDRHLQF